MNSFNEMGWALPSRAFFRYTERQRKILYNIFTSGRDKNKKATVGAGCASHKRPATSRGICEGQTSEGFILFRLDKKGELNMSNIHVDENDSDLVKGTDGDAVAFNQHVQT